ncbi:secondary thiamine-phosphate synthase enzyme YjbQ [Patescibacteria group bacterium]|nr:secondary thiamine-phosphate synthase enzyme YjbQ [Patescibacteria group bacterium]
MKYKELTVETKKNKQIVDVTDDIKSFIHANKVIDAIVTIFITHTTAALTTADLDPGTDLDFLDFLEKVTPKMNFRHPHNPAHTPDHIWSSIIGTSLSIPVKDGELVLGTWQRIILVELDGPRSRSLLIAS